MTLIFSVLQGLSLTLSNILITKPDGPDGIELGKITMRRILIVAAAVFSMVLFTQCSKSTSCKCEEYDNETHYHAGSTTMDPESWGAKNCNDLELKLRAQALQIGYDGRYECHKE